MIELQGISNTDKIERPENIDYSVAISQHTGVVTSGKIIIIQSDTEMQNKKYLKLEISLDSESDDISELVVMTEISWLPGSDLIKLLIDLEMLPQEGETLRMDELPGAHVDLVAQALDYEGLYTTSVVAVKRIEGIEIWADQKV